MWIRVTYRGSVSHGHALKLYYPQYIYTCSIQNRMLSLSLPIILYPCFKKEHYSLPLAQMYKVELCLLPISDKHLGMKISCNIIL